MEFLIFFAVLWVLWSMSSRRWKRQIIYPLAIMGLVYAFLTSQFMLTLASQGLMSTLPQDSGERTDAIVVLGRGEPFRSKRVELAAELWQSQRASTIFVSGMLDAEEMIAELHEQGIPKSQLSGERCSQTTEENAQFTSAVLRQQGIKKILLLTDVPHMLRSQILFQNFGFTVIPRPIALPVSWSTTRQLSIVLREYAGLIGYHWQSRLRQRTQEEIDRPSEKVTYRLKAWNCQVQKISDSN
ncbi:MAG: YdcF family protein [Pseudanabaena sp. CAN_BIN31]|nr:YdcF family protein [Pseudanabaena sp. CAN_BIN31]